ncbi:MAG: hypothetical protein MJ170_03245 [Alphaproteobacteria bacterium]|nr:hypothetical protein [Alphaproteobacteria bacterium]
MSVKLSDFLGFIVMTFLVVSVSNADTGSNGRTSAVIRTIGTGESGIRSGANIRAGSVRLERGTNASGTNKSVNNISRTASTSRNAQVNSVARSAINTQKTNVGRSAVAPKTTTSVGRSAITPVNVGRATAVFSDVSKIGSGYAECRDAYATCMDQFCAVMNDKYRRCYCSEKLSEFQNTEDALDQAVSLLAKFEDNNLNAVDKTAAEVNAMYSATAGEAAIKNDTSGAAQMLNEIGDLLAGKKSKTTNTYTSLNGTSIDFSVEIDDIWSDTSASNIFATSGAKDLSTLSGVELYNNAITQCLEITADSCQNDAVLNMAKSSYSIMISQDCNAYSKNIDSKREQVKQTVRTAEKYLREARLDEYRSHNSADMNECITKVKTAIQQDLACGENYNRCLDNTGAYINSTTGEPIYSPRLFQLTDLIKLDGVKSDVLSQNDTFNKFLDSKRKFAETALSTCRDIADDVWTEFKRTALIEIAQAQDEKIESVKMSCIQTISECYDRQSEGLKELDKSTSKTALGSGIVATRDTCKNEVIACASLYGDTNGCSFDGNGKLVAGNNNNGTHCGLTSLLKFVDTVDIARVSEACDTALENYLHSLCTPKSGTYGYPYQCRLITKKEIEDSLTNYATQACTAQIGDTTTNGNSAKITQLVDDLEIDMDIMLADICESLDGNWTTDSLDRIKENKLTTFYSQISGGSPNTPAWGTCVEKSVRNLCNDLGSELASYYNATTNTCELTDKWYKEKCAAINGYWENNNCYIISGGK